MSGFDKNEAYRRSLQELDAVLDGIFDRIAVMATMNCILKTNFPYYYWVGFYLVKDGRLLVGPYQGTLGCLTIEFGRGVCGLAAREQTTRLVSDVRAFPGHIACDARSRSEIVVPVLDEKGGLIAVLDVDSDQVDSFDEIDRTYLEKIIHRFFAERQPGPADR